MPTQSQVDQQILILGARGHALRTASPADFETRARRLEEAVETAGQWIAFDHGPGGESDPPAGVSATSWASLIDVRGRQYYSLRAERGERSGVSPGAPVPQDAQVARAAPIQVEEPRPGAPTGKAAPPEGFVAPVPEPQGFMAWLNPVQRPVYQRPWFVALVGVSGTALAWSTWQYIKQLKAKRRR